MAKPFIKFSSARSFYIGGSAAFALVLLIIVALAAATKQGSGGGGSVSKSSPFVVPPSDAKSDGPFASVEHFCADSGSCPLGF
jgi:hypothetical protein